MDKNQALSKAMALCSRRECSEADIRGKLKFWGTLHEDIDWIIGELIKEKFIDDLRFTIAYVRDKIRLNQWGRIKIRYMLSMEKVKHSIIDQALEKIDEDLYTETLKELLQKKARELKNESNPYNKKQKLIKFAQGRGFEVDMVLKELKDLT
ncbi:MAG: regulatory protein RecX [Bacteroidales bacterium]